MKSEAGMSKCSELCDRRFRHSDLVIPSDLVICHSDFENHGSWVEIWGFTLKDLQGTVPDNTYFQLDFNGHTSSAEIFAPSFGPKNSRPRLCSEGKVK